MRKRMSVVDNYLELIAVSASSSFWPINEARVLAESARLEEELGSARFLLKPQRLGNACNRLTRIWSSLWKKLL